MVAKPCAQNTLVNAAMRLSCVLQCIILGGALLLARYGVSHVDAAPTYSRSHQPARKASKSLSVLEATVNEHQIRCGACQRAVHHMWDLAVERRDHCLHPSRETLRDDDCELTRITEQGIRKLVEGACDSMMDTHVPHIAEHGFDLTPHKHAPPPAQDALVRQRVADACRKWVHFDPIHNVERVAQLIFVNVAYGKTQHEILHKLQHRFCWQACDHQPPEPRKKKPGHGLPLEQHEDFTYAHAVEQAGGHEAVRRASEGLDAPRKEAAEEEDDDEF